MRLARAIVVVGSLWATSTQATPPAERAVSVQPGTYRITTDRGCLRTSQVGDYIHLRAVCVAADPIFSIVRDSPTMVTVRGPVIDGRNYCASAGKLVAVGATRVDYAACKVIETLPGGAAKKPSIAAQQFRIEPSPVRPGRYRIVSDAYSVPKCWDVSDSDRWDVYLKPCADIAGQHFQFVSPSRQLPESRYALSPSHHRPRDRYRYSRRVDVA